MAYIKIVTIQSYEQQNHSNYKQQWNNYCPGYVAP